MRRIFIMKKKSVIGVLTFLLSASVLSACGGSDAKTIDGTVNVNVTDNAEDDTVVEDEEADVAQEEESSLKGYTYSYEGVDIEIDALAAPLVEALGEPLSYFEAKSCAFEGLDKMYTYSSFELDTYPTGDDDFVSAVIFKDDSISTPEGIRIGSTLDEVKRIYGEDFKEDVGQIIYEKDGMHLVFIISEDIVASIEYRTTVLN